MGNKSNSLNKINRHQREKVLRFSIRKYSFGAASVAVAALMFLGARVVSADTVSGSSSQSTAGVVQPNDKGDSPVGIKEPTENKSEVVNNSLENKETALVENSSNTVDKSQLRTVVEELNALLSTKLNLDDSVLSSVKERVQRAQALLDKADAVQKDINELKELLSADLATLSNAVKESSEVRESNTGTETEKPANQSSSEVRASEENQTVSAKKDSLKVSVDQLQAAILEVPKHDTTKKVLEKANELLGVAQVVLENTTVSLNEVEDMTKRVKRMFISVKNATTRLTSGARDSRNGQRMAQGTGFRANGEINQGALTNIKYFASVDPSQNGGRDTRNNEPEFTRNKTDIQATYVKDSEGQWIVYDVFFNNDGRKMVDKSFQQHYYFQGPFNIMDLTPGGGYKSNTVKDLRFTRYRNDGGRRLSDGGRGFTQYGNTVTISNPASQQRKIFDNDSDSFYDPNSGVTGNSNQPREVFKNNQNDPVLNTLTKNKSGKYPGLSYYLGVDVHRASVEYAIHMHVKIKLRDNVTSEEVATYGRVYAASVTKGSTTNQSYIMGATGTRLQNDPEASLYPLKGSSHTKTVGDTLPNPENPVEAGYITLKNGGEFPAGMTWGWKNGNRPSTDTAGIFTYTATARYKDGTISNDADGAVKFTVKPKKPAITTSVANKKGLTNQQITVNVGKGVPKNSKVKIYDGKTVIGTGTTNGETATVTVKEALSGKPITAETVVTNSNGTVTSDKSKPVTPTEAPDTQPPTLEISSKEQTVVEGATVTFTVTARDDKHVNFDPSDLTTKYSKRLITGNISATPVTNTDTEQTRRITITTTAEDVGKTNTITFKATDNAGHAAKPVTFTFHVTPRDNQKPIVEVGGVRLTETEPKSAQFYVYRGATFNPTVKAWDDSGNIKSMSVENLPNGSTPQTYTAQTGKTEATPYATPLSSGTVADTQTLGDHVAKFKISDGVNSAIYQMKYKVVDVVVENTPKPVELNSKSGDPNEYLNTAGQQDQSGKPVVGSQADVHFPVGMNFRWDNANGSDTNITLSKVGTQTHKAIAVFPENPSRRDGAQVFAPKTAERDVVFNVVDNEKPKSSLNGKELSETANEPIFTVYRGATFNPELKVSDNSGVISKVEVKGGLPKGVTPDPGVTPSTFTAQTGKDGSSEDKKYKTRLSSGTVLNTETLGVHESTIHVEGSSPSDSRDFKFKYRVVDIETKNVDENSIAKVSVASTLNKANSSKNIDAHNYLKVVDSKDLADRGNNYLPQGMTWTWKDRDGVNKDGGTTLDNSGKYTRTAVAIFPGTKANNWTDETSTIRDVFAPAEIKRKVILAVTPTAPIVEGKENGSVTITPPTRPDSTNKQDIDKITLTYVPTGKTTPETVTVTKSGNTWTATVNGKPTDKVSVSSEGVVTISDTEIADKTEVTAKVSKNIDGVLTLESPVAIGTANGPLAAEVTNPAPVPEKAQITPVTVVTPNKPGSSITVDGKINGLTVDEEGKLKGTPEVNDWKPKEEERKITIPVKVKHGDEIVTKDVPVTIQRDTDGDAIPDVKDPDDDNDGIPDEEEIKNGTDPKVPTTQTPTIGITRKENGDAIVTPTKPGGGTYPRGTTVTIPGNDNTPIEVTIGNDGSGTVPNDKLPKTDKPGTGTVTEPNKAPSKPVKVTTPARKTPTVALDQDPDTGEVTVTPKKPDGTLYPENTKVEIPGKDKDHPITITIGKDGKGKVPNSELPEGKVPGTSKITVPGKPAVEVPNVTTPSKLIPTVALDQDPDTGEVTVTPKKPDGTLYPENTKVEIPGKDKDHPITITIGKDGKGKVPNSELPEGKVPGTSKITVPGKPAVEVPNVTTPSKLIPTVALDQDPDTGEVTVTPKKPDGTLYPENTKVEIPGKDKDHPITITIGKDGKGKVPNSELPEGKVPGTSKITVPGKPAVEVPNVTTPSKLIPTVALDQDPDTGEVTVTPKKPDGTLYPENTKVEIPGKDKDHPITITIGKDGKGKVPNSELPEGKVPGTSKITVPGKPAVEVPNVTTPSKLIPTVALDQDPDTGEVTVTPKKPDGTLYPENTKVEIPGKDKEHPITVTIGKDGKGKVPNSKLPEGKVPGTSKITVPGKPAVEVPNVTTPSKLIPTVALDQDPDTGEVTVTPKKPDGTLYPENTKVEIPGKDKDHPITITIGKDGKGKVPNSELPDGKVPGTGKITEPGKPAVEVPVTTPGKVTPNTPTTETPSEIEITRKPNGDAIVTPKKPDGKPYPSGSKVVIPGENNTPIEVTIGDNGSGEVPNDKLPKKDVPGTGTVTEPNKKPSQPVDVTTPARKTPTVDVEQDPKTGDVTVTPKKPDGSTFPPGTKVEIPGKDGNPITVTIGEDGKGKVPNSELPDGKVPGTGKITEPGKPAVEVPVTTPGKVTPNTPTTETPSEIEITRKPNGDAIVTPKKPDGKPYPSGSKVVIPGENNTPIEVTIGDNGSGEVPNDKLPKKDVPGTGTVTEPNKKPSQPVDVTTPARKTPTVDVEQDPKTGDVTVTPKKPDGSTFPPGTKVEIPGKDGNPITVTIGEDGKGKVPNSELPDGKVPGTGKITEPGKPAVEVPVTTPGKVTPNTPTTETPSEIEITRKPNGDAIVTPKKPDGKPYPSGSKVVIPGENNTPIEVTIGDNGSGEVPNDKLPKKDVPGTGTVTEPNKKPSQPVDVTTPARKTPTVDVEQDPKTGDVTVTPKKPDGSTFPPGTKVEIPGKDGNPITVTIGEDGKGKVPNSELPDGKVPGTGKITEPGKPAVEVPVTTPGKVTPNTPTTETPSEIEITRKPNGDAIVTPKKPDGKPYPSGSKVVIPGENNTPIEVTIGDNGSGEVPNDKLPKKDVPGTGTVTEPNKKPSQPVDVTTPARKTPTVDVEQDPKTGDVTVTPKKPDGSTFPPGTKVEIPGKDGNPITVTIGEDGKGKVPNSELPDGKVPGTGKITEPGKPAVEVPVTTPGKVTPNTPTTETPSEIEITRKPNGDAIVTPKKPDGKPYPSGSKVVIPGENNTPIEVTIGDNGSGEVPNDKLPKKDVPGTGTVTEPNKKPSQPVDVTTPARKTPTVDVEQDPKTGDVTVTPKKPDGSTFPPGTKVEIPGKDGNPITVTIGEDGKGKVPNSELPDGKVPGTGKITEPGKPAVEVPVTTPGKVTPNTPTTETPSEIEITRKPNGDAIVTPKKPDGKPYPSGSKVVIPGENNTPIEVTIGDNGSGEVPNDKLPKKDVPGTGTVTEPNKKPSQPVDVTTPARKTPTVDVEQDPKTGDVTVTPKKPDGSTFPPGTKVEIPGKDGNPITVTIGEDGKGKVPNSELPDGKVPGTGKITEPGKPAVEVPVTTPGKVTPNTPTTETPSEIEITRKPNGDAIVTPKKPDGKPYPSGSKVVIPGENNTPIEVTIGDNGSGEVPNDKLPKKDVPGTGTVTEPNKKPSQPVDVTTPARKTPTVDVEQDPKTGDVTVTPKKPDGSTFPPGTKVEIPGKDGNPITVTIGEDGKGKVPNSELPDGKVPGTGKITEPGKPAVEVPVTTPGKVTPNTPTTETPSEIEITRKPNGDAIVTPKKPDGKPYPSGSKVVIPGENNTPIEVTIGDNGSGEVPNDKLPKKDVPGTGTVTEPNKKPSQPVDVTTPARKTPTVDVEQDPKTGDVTVTPKKPDGSTFPPGTKVEIPGKDGNPITVTIGEDGKGKVPNSELPDGKVPGTGKITEPGKPAVEVPVTTPGKVTPNTPTTETPSEIEITRKPNGDAIVTPKKPDGKPYPSGSKVVIPGENNTPIEVTIGDNGSGEVPNDKLPKKDVPGTGTVTEPNKKPSQPVDVTTPARKTPTVDVEQDPKTGDVTVTPKKPDGSTFPPGTKVEIPGKDGNPITVTIGEDGKGKVPNSELPDGKVPGTGKITEPGKPAVEVPVTTPGKVTPNTPTTETPSEIEITRKPNGDAIVTPKKPDGKPYPSGSKVVIPGENNTPIEVTIGDNGSGEVPNDKLPKKDVPGTGTVTEPNKKPSQPVDVTTPARKTPTVDVEQDPKTGDVTVTPKKPDGSTFPPGTKVEIPGKDGNPITVTIGEDGKGKVPNSELPDGKVPGTGKITEPGKPAVEVPVTTPGKVTPNTPTTETPSEIEITRKPNGDAIVTPKKPDGKPYPSGSKVVIPGENNTPIEVTIGDNGSGEVPNDKLPKKDVPGTGTVTEPNKKPSQPVDVTTPARKTPTVDVEQDPKTGDVTVTPKKPDGSTFPPGTKVEIPGKDGNPITVTIGEDGKGKVPNSELPDGKVPGTGKITEPGKPAVEVPVTTPGKVTPNTPTTETPSEIEITRKPNGDAIVTPKKPDGKPYPSGSKVVIPGENNTPIEVTIGDNGSGEVPNDKLPKKDVPGTGTVTEPNKKPSQPVDVTTPARKTPTVDVEQDPKTGDVTVTPKKPDGSTFPPGTKVEIPGKDGNPITVTIGEDGKGKVPNSELPDGKVPGTGKITEPGKPAVEVPVTTPGKVTPATPDMPVKPDTNGGSGQDKPAPATPTPNADQVDTKTTVDNGAKSNDSQNVLPNTGTESNAALASLGLLGLLSGFGLVARKKKKTKNLVR